MKRIITGVAVVCLLMLGGDTSGMADQASDPSLSDVMWKAVILALEERDMKIQTASENEGKVVTEFALLNPETVREVVSISEKDQGVKWGRAEYRYLVDIGGRSDPKEPSPEKQRIVIRAEIFAWEQGSEPTSEKRRALISNNALEKDLLQSFSTALGKVN